MLIIEDPTVKCRTAIKVPFFYFNLCSSIMLYLVSHVHLHPYPFLPIKNKIIKNVSTRSNAPTTIPYILF